MNILLFGPNWSGKGTHGAILQQKLGVHHIETGVTFRKSIFGNTDIGRRAKEYINRGELVPDDITIPMIMNRIKKPISRTDGCSTVFHETFPRQRPSIKPWTRGDEPRLCDPDHS